MDRISAKPDHQPLPELSARDWQLMEYITLDAQEFQQARFGDFEFRFVPMVDQTFSALLSYRGIDVFHFMWTEVDGLVEITHRLVNPEFRGQGLATKAMEMLGQRVQSLSNAKQSRYSLSMETSQLSVVKLALKSGMQLTQGADIFKTLSGAQDRYRVDEKSHVRDGNNYGVVFRLSKAFQPEIKLLQDYRSSFHSDILGVLSMKAA